MSTVKKEGQFCPAPTNDHNRECLSRIIGHDGPIEMNLLKHDVALESNLCYVMYDYADYLYQDVRLVKSFVNVEC